MSTFGSGSGSRGQAVVEFAVIVPIMLALLLGAVDMGRIFFVYVGAQNAAREGAAYGAYNPGCPVATPGTCADPANVTYVARQELQGDPALAVVIDCPDGCTSTTTHPGNTMEVTVSYPVDLLFPGMSGHSFVLQASATAVIQ